MIAEEFVALYKGQRVRFLELDHVPPEWRGKCGVVSKSLNDNGPSLWQRESWIVIAMDDEYDVLSIELGGRCFPLDWVELVGKRRVVPLPLPG